MEVFQEPCIPCLHFGSCPVISPRSLRGFSQSYFDMAIPSYACRYYLLLSV